MAEVCFHNAFKFTRRVALLLVVVGLVGWGCDRKSSPGGEEDTPSAPNSVSSSAEPGPSVPEAEETIEADDIPVFAANSPFDANDEAPTEIVDGKYLWAKSILWEEAPELIVEKWLTEKPDTEGKCVLIEFWATWCPPCRKSIALLNQFQQAFGEELVVIGISHESEEDVRKLTEPRPEYYLAIDTQHRTKDALGVSGIPHVIILEPGGYVVWEGFPDLKGYELTEEIVREILKVASEG